MSEDENKWCLEEIWYYLMSMEQNRDKLSFQNEVDFYNLMAKGLKIINKVLCERNRIKK